MLQTSGRALRIEAASSATNDARVVGESPILSAAGDFPCFRIDCYHPAAGKRSNIRTATLIEGQVPCRERAAPVAKRSAESLAPLAPIRQIAGIGVIRPAFGPVHLCFRIRFMDFAHHVGSASVAVPRNRIGILAKRIVLQCAYGASP